MDDTAEISLSDVSVSSPHLEIPELQCRDSEPDPDSFELPTKMIMANLLS
jgi:hypothetical protein